MNPRAGKAAFWGMMGLLFAIVMITSLMSVVRDGESPGRVLRDLADPLSILGAVAGCWIASILGHRFFAQGRRPSDAPPEEESCSK